MLVLGQAINLFARQMDVLKMWAIPLTMEALNYDIKHRPWPNGVTAMLAFTPSLRGQVGLF